MNLKLECLKEWLADLKNERPIKVTVYPKDE